MLLLFLLLPLLYLIRGDLPVHCLQSETVGEWEFTVNQDLYQHNIRDKRVACSNGFPNQVQKYKKIPKFSFVYQHKWKAQLRVNNTATLINSDKKRLQGNWTMIYDQGFAINVPGYQFLAFFLYLDGQKERYTRSVCGRTLTGWYNIHSQNKMSCFFAIKTDVNNTKIKVDFAPRFERSRKPDILRKQTVLAREAIQAAILVQEVEDKAVLKSPPKYTQDQLKKAFDEANKYYKMKAPEVPLIQLPKTFDWRNVSGVDFLTPPRQQGRCGSCYAIANIEAMEARARIKNKNLLEPNMSAEFLLKCGIYTQGCHGGYSFTAAKFLKDFGVPTEAEVPYKPHSKEDCFKILLKRLKFHKIKDFEYLGGHYNKASEDIMIKQLRAHGPFAVGMLPGHFLKGYKGGIIRGSSSTSLIEDETVNHYGMMYYKKQWEQVQHAVLLIGYGETQDGEKYWILRNSWGKKWGLKGDFLVERGVDALNIESLAVALLLG